MEELTGQLVLVHPDLIQDPVSRQGQVGVIAMADLKSDTITVGFGGSPLGRYSADALLVLKEKNELYRDIMHDPKSLEADTFKQLLKINMLQENPGYGNISDALKIVAGQKELIEHSMISLENHIAKHYGMDTSAQASMGR
ncbi:hypothetical protein [Pedobacter suwonensis]|uniref:hypothetical protein n=1 Tax=Pedobacter suwonensis TaxID=332999 RepID=UPI003697AD03